MRNPLPVVVWVAMLAGCATPPHAARTDAAETIWVTVTNHAWHEVAVYLVRGSAGRPPVGHVRAAEVRRFDITALAPPAPADLRLLAVDPTSRRELYSIPFSLEAGGRADWTLLGDLSHSELVVSTTYVLSAPSLRRRP